MEVTDIVGKMPVEVLYYTDPACPWSWACEPKLRRLMWEFGDGLRFRWVMSGLARQFDTGWAREEGLRAPEAGPGMALRLLEAGTASGMPFDPLSWVTSPPTSSYPACMAVEAAAEQGSGAAYRYLRRLREGLMAEGRRLDHPESLIAAAGEAGLDVARFRIDLNSPAIVEAFAADLEQAREGGHELPALGFPAPDGATHTVSGRAPYDQYREAAVGAGAEPAGAEPLDPLAVVERFGRVATVEVEELSGRPAPVVRSELWAAARDWRLRAVPAPIGELWEKA